FADDGGEVLVELLGESVQFVFRVGEPVEDGLLQLAHDRLECAHQSSPPKSRAENSAKNVEVSVWMSAPCSFIVDCASSSAARSAWNSSESPAVDSTMGESRIASMSAGTCSASGSITIGASWFSNCSI